MYGLYSILNAHSNRLNAIAFSPNERLFASCSVDGGLKLWELATGNLLCTQFVPGIQSLNFSQDGQIIAVRLTNGESKLFKITKKFFSSMIQMDSIEPRDIPINRVVSYHQIQASISPEGYLVLKDDSENVIETLGSIPGGCLYSTFAFSSARELLLGGLQDGTVLVLKKVFFKKGDYFKPSVPRILINKSEALRLKPVNLLAEGMFFNIYSCKIGDYEVAVKIINKKDIALKIKEHLIKSETNIHSLLNHPNIAQFYDVADVGGDLGIFLELLTTSLSIVLDDATFGINYTQQLKIAQSVAEGIKYLHKMNIIHRDIKSPNVLVKIEGKEIIEIKVSDFRLSKQIKEGEAHIVEQDFHGTSEYLAPEIYKMAKYSFKSDVYAFGVLLWELSTRKIPFKDVEPKEVQEYVSTGGKLELKASENSDYNALIKDCWSLNYNNRPDITYVATQLSTLLTIDLRQASEEAPLPPSTSKITEIF